MRVIQQKRGFPELVPAVLHMSPAYPQLLQPAKAAAKMRYDINDNFHLFGYMGPGLHDAADTARYSWYASALLTF
jgi:hypothetical protein